MATRLEVFFDYRSPFAYLLWEILPAVAERHAAEVAWRPIDLLGLSNFAGGLPYTEKKRAYVFVDVVRQAAYHDVPIQPPDPFPVDSNLALRAAGVAADAADAPDVAEVHRAFFHAAWRDRRDLGSEQVVAKCLARAGVDPTACLAEAKGEAAAAQLCARTRAADDAGVFGVPTLVHEGELFWGLDALPVLEWRLRGGGGS